MGSLCPKYHFVYPLSAFFTCLEVKRGLNPDLVSSGDMVAHFERTNTTDLATTMLIMVVISGRSYGSNSHDVLISLTSTEIILFVIIVVFLIMK